MGRTYLILNFMARMAAWVAGFGAVLAFVFTLMLSLSISLIALYAIPFGAISGIMLGAMTGFIMGVVTYAFYLPPTNESVYRFAMLLSSVVTTLVGGFALFYTWLSAFVLDYHSDPAHTLSISIIFAIIAVIASGHASHLVATWYLKQQTAAQKD